MTGQVKTVIHNGQHHGGGLVAVDYIDVGAFIQQQVNHFPVAIAGGPVHSSKAAGWEVGILALGECVDAAPHVRISTGIEEGFGDVKMSFSGSPHDCGLIVQRLHVIGVGAGFK